jgi:hypothetical protein
MIRFLFAIAAAALLFTGCANKRGISATYYNDCREYYDLYGYYHKKCDENLIEYEEAGNAIKDSFREESAPEPENRKVW